MVLHHSRARSGLELCVSPREAELTASLLSRLGRNGGRESTVSMLRLRSDRLPRASRSPRPRPCLLAQCRTPSAWTPCALRVLVPRIGAGHAHHQRLRVHRRDIAERYGISAHTDYGSFQGALQRFDPPTDVTTRCALALWPEARFIFTVADSIGEDLSRLIQACICCVNRKGELQSHRQVSLTSAPRSSWPT